MRKARVFGYLTDMNYRRPFSSTTPLYSDLVRGGRPARRAPRETPLLAFIRRMKKGWSNQEEGKSRAKRGDRIAG